MTNVLPVLSGSGIMSFLGSIRPYTDVQPFTYRDGITYQEMLEAIRGYLEDTLVPYVTDGFAQINVRDIISAVVTAVADGDVVVTDAEISAVLDQPQSQTVAKLLALLDAKNGELWAPAPKGNGQDDTPVLQPLVDLAQTVNGKLKFRNGTYLCNIATAQSFNQPQLLGQGFTSTFLKAYDNTKPAVRMKGGSGKLSNGFLADLAIVSSDAGGGIGLQLADTNGVRWTRIRFDGTFDYGIEFLNEAVNGFTEYNHGDADFRSGVKTAVHYKRSASSTAESFHGSGIDSGTVINQTAGMTTPMVVVEAGCFPYGAPLKAAVFPRNSNVPIIRNLNSSRLSSFFAELDIEVQGGATNIEVADSVTGFGVGLFGPLISLVSGGPLKMGIAKQYSRMMYQGTTTIFSTLPYSENGSVTANPANLVKDRPSNSLIFVEFDAPNYNYQALLSMSRSSFDPGGRITVLSEGNYVNVTGWGKPTFDVANNLPRATNAAFPVDGTVKIYASVTPLNHTKSSDRLSQY